MNEEILNGIAGIILIVGFAITMIIIFAGLMSEELVRIIRAIRGEKEEDES